MRFICENMFLLSGELNVTLDSIREIDRLKVVGTNTNSRVPLVDFGR